MRNRTTNRRKKGAVIAESAAALVVLLPVVVLMIFVALEVSYAYLLKSALSEAAREAARSLSIAYGIDSSVKGNRDLENQKVFDNIRIHNVVNNSLQFDDPVWNDAADPPTVSVTVRYASDQYGLPHFPAPDPLHLGDNFVVYGSATYRLQ